jgi:hypothetical protein
MYLVFPEVRDSKFHEHALPGAYYGPSRFTESENYCDVWNGTRFFAIHKGCLRIDERSVLALSSRTNKVAQPFTKEAIYLGSEMLPVRLQPAGQYVSNARRGATVVQEDGVSRQRQGTSHWVGCDVRAR